MTEYKFVFPYSIEYRRRALQQSVLAVRFDLIVGLGFALVLILAMIWQVQGPAVTILLGLTLQFLIMSLVPMIRILSERRYIEELEREREEFEADPAGQEFLAELDAAIEKDIMDYLAENHIEVVDESAENTP